MGEGKTSVATNLAAVFSRAGHRVAIVDADLRRPRVAAVFEQPSKPGLSDVLARRVTLREALVVVDDGRLGILASGAIPANPSEALGGTGMEKVIAQLAADYEYVFIDTPPVLPVTDALVVAPMVDGVVLVTRLGRTTRERVKRALAAIDRVNAVPIGVVPNYAGKGADRDYRYGYKYTGSHKKMDETPADIDADLLQPTTHQASVGSGCRACADLPAHTRAVAAVGGRSHHRLPRPHRRRPEPLPEPTAGRATAAEPLPDLYLEPPARGRTTSRPASRAALRRGHGGA